MIHPDMATLLGVLTTDAVSEPGVLQPFWKRVADRTFNSISVDGDTSTNDTVLLLANGHAGIDPCGPHELVAPGLGHLPDTGKRRSQIAFDVDRERFERRDVQHAASGGFGRHRREHEAIEAPQKCRQRFPLPVGDRISVESPRAIAGQPSVCGRVGASKARANHSRTAG